MGCNLCTLQKREEHYKLLYEIAQVNGRDFSKAGHEAAVEAIRKDPVVVQVLRRGPAATGNVQDGSMVDVCTQTDITFEHIMALAKLRPATPPVPDICPFLLSDSCPSIQTMEHEYFECPEYLSNPRAEIERTDDFEYEEVELCRLNSQEKLGLTLCYRTDDEEDTAIYVSQVGPLSIAARDGRIREGDRILQINGHDVQDRNEAVAILCNEDTRNVVLLVTRPGAQMDEGWLDEEQHDYLEELKMEILEEQRKEEIFQMANCNKQSKMPEEDDAATDTATCSSSLQDKDSGVGRGGEESAEPHAQIRTQKHTRHRWEAEPHSIPTETSGLVNQVAGQEGGRSQAGVERDRFRQLLELKCQIRNGRECGLVYRRSSTIACSVTEQAGGGVGMERELRMLNEELRSIERECQSLMQTHRLRRAVRGPGRPGQEGRVCGAKLADITEQPERAAASEKSKDKDSSSAYNTAESSRSTPLGTEGSPEHSLQRHASQAHQRSLRGVHTQGASRSSTLTTHDSCTHSKTLPTHGKVTPVPQTPITSPGSQGPGQALSSSLEQSPSNPSESDPALPADDERCERARRRNRPAAPPHHPNSAPGPAHATRHYQSYVQLLQQQQQQQQQRSSSSLECSPSQLSLLGLRGRPSPPPLAPPPSAAAAARLEWKVKVRAAARRPARDRILRERALRIREERSGGMTTDDDAASELKMGRYWSKEERKQQLARAREQRRRREFMQRCRLEWLRQAAGAEVSVLELSHRKMLKKRSRKILDNWMTIQELVSHGARAPDGTKVHNAFLSVTTV
ncbi:PDZ domain-containing RING finger protein 4 [Electrophorus electricus]|uniref:PDZ domain-containing RING finger protein 4 n=1 Tax=Electrophorus electricus TaxID=8005 RepID=UPI0015CFB1A4|nr:PDZ domain-containing RING finger protein 4 [Electrophorus electricus]